ncbi:MAG: hypothetical protein ACREQ9_24795, partial [Candidatus Binatia bacterium]
MAVDADDQRARILAALTAESSPLRRRATALVIDFALARTLRELVDRGGLVALIRESIRMEGVVRVVRERAPEVWRRHVERSREQSLTVGGVLPKAVRARLRRTIAETPPPALSWARGAVDPAVLRRLVAPIVQDVLTAFVQRLPGLGSAEATWPGLGLATALGSRVRDEIGKRAGQVMGAGRAVLGGIGIDVAREIEAATRDFSQNAEEHFRAALARRIRTPEGRKLLGEIQAELYDRLLAARFEDLREDVESLPWTELAEAVAPAFDHLRKQPFFARALEDEIEAWLAADGDRPLADLLDEVGLLAPVRRYLSRRGERFAAELFASAAFEEWLGDLL